MLRPYQYAFFALLVVGRCSWLRWHSLFGPSFPSCTRWPHSLSILIDPRTAVNNSRNTHTLSKDLLGGLFEKCPRRVMIAGTNQNQTFNLKNKKTKKNATSFGVQRTFTRESLWKMKEAMTREYLKLLPRGSGFVNVYLLSTGSYFSVVALSQFSAIGQVSGKAFFNAAH